MAVRTIETLIYKARTTEEAKLLKTLEGFIEQLGLDIKATENPTYKLVGNLVFRFSVSNDIFVVGLLNLEAVDRRWITMSIYDGQDVRKEFEGFVNWHCKEGGN